MKYIIIFLVPWLCLYWIYKIILALAVNSSRISREEEFVLLKADHPEKELCSHCDCYDSD